jgi:hypothetical protein
VQGADPVGELLKQHQARAHRDHDHKEGPRGDRSADS